MAPNAETAETRGGHNSGDARSQHPGSRSAVRRARLAIIMTIFMITTIDTSAHVSSAAENWSALTGTTATTTTGIVAVRGIVTTTTTTTVVVLSVLEFYSDQTMTLIVSGNDAIEGSFGDTHHWDGDGGGR
jgi:hypothetical protein